MTLFFMQAECGASSFVVCASYFQATITKSKKMNDLYHYKLRVIN